MTSVRDYLESIKTSLYEISDASELDSAPTGNRDSYLRFIDKVASEAAAYFKKLADAEVEARS